MTAANVSAGCAEEEIAIGDVPAVVIAAGSKARKGFVAASSSLIHNGDETVYELEGRANGQPVELRVAPDGTLLSIEEDDEDDE